MNSATYPTIADKGKLFTEFQLTNTEEFQVIDAEVMMKLYNITILQPLTK